MTASAGLFSDGTSPAPHPFGLPMGTVRGILSVIICGFFWLTLLWPSVPVAVAVPQTPGDTPALVQVGDTPVRALLAHFFLLGLVLLAFGSASPAEAGHRAAFLPRILRMILVIGSIAAVAFAAVKDMSQLQHRLTPSPAEVTAWWVPFLATTAGGFAFGLALRTVIGKDNHIFRTLRAWLSVVGILLMLGEVVLALGINSSQDGKSVEVVHIWQCVEVLVVSAYFGTRA